MEPWVRDILRCPACRGGLADGPSPPPTSRGAHDDDAGPGPLGPVTSWLTCAACRLAYPVCGAVPLLLADEAVAC